MGFSKSEKKGVCDLCKREDIPLTVHHLIPREEGGRDGEKIEVCWSCHKQLHSLYSNKELSIRLNSIERIKDDEKMKKFLKWIKKQPSTKAVKIKKSKNIRRKK